MTAPNDRHRKRAETLRDRIRMSLALDDAMAGELHRAGTDLVASGDGKGAEEVTRAARRHRVGAIKHRAILSAKGIDV